MQAATPWRAAAGILPPWLFALSGLHAARSGRFFPVPPSAYPAFALPLAFTLAGCVDGNYFMLKIIRS
jgi:hypothetical protein